MAPPRLYIYYRVTEATLPATVAQVQRLQAALVAAHPGLQAELLRRPELQAGEVTLMEVYAGALTPTVEAAITQATGALPGPRHIERFHLLERHPDDPR